MTFPLPLASAWIGALLSAVGAGAHAQSYTLDFGSSAAHPFLGCADVGNVCSTFDRLLPSYGDVAGVVDVSTRSSDGGTLRWWNSNYNELYGVAFNNVSSLAAPVWVDLVPLAAGSAVNLLHFDLGGYLGQRHNVAVSVLDLGSGATLFSRVGDIGTPQAGGGWGQHTGFDLALGSFSGLRIQWSDPAVSANTAIDNIRFSIGAPVPEPSGGALAAAGLGSLLWLLRRRRAVAGSGLALGLLAAGAAQAAAPQAYTMQTMPLLAGATLSPWIEGMNAMGQVVGRTDVGSQVFATLWAVGQPARQLGALPATQPWAMAHAISDAGVVVGDASWGSAYATHGFRWTAEGGMQDLSLGWAGGADTRALGINTAGQIAGSVTQAGGIVAAVFQPDGSWTNLGHALAGAAGDDRISTAYDISGSGWVVGTSSNSTSMRAFRWSPQGGMTTLQQFVAGSRDTAAAVNEMGWSAGTSWLGGSSSDARAVAWDAQGRIVPLQGSDWLYSHAVDINAAGTVVGEATRADGRHAFVWNQDGGMVALDPLVLNFGGLRLLEADAINEAGQIAGVAWDPVALQVSAFLLTPAAVPEPAPAALLAAGLAGLAWRRRAQRART